MAANNKSSVIWVKIWRMANIGYVCNGVWDQDLWGYLARYPTDSIDELRTKERICNKYR
jgi:hypothetical protein